MVGRNRAIGPRLQSFNENLPGATPHMSIFGEIDLRNLRFEERTDAFDNLKSDISDILFAKPCHNYAPLQRSRQAAEFFDRQMLISRGGRGCHPLDPIFFFGCNGRGAPDAGPNFATERFFQIRNDAMPQPIAQRSEIFVRGIFAKFQAILSHVRVNLVAPNSEYGADNCKIDIFDSPDGNIAHGSETGETGATEKINQKRLDQIVGVMGQKDCVTASVFRDFCKELIARLARGGFDRDLLFSRHGADIRGFDFKIDIVFGRESFDKARIGPARSEPQLMIKMANNQISISKIDQPMEQHDGIPAAGNTKEVVASGRKFAEKFF
jgi:hypothetical protein